MLVTGEKNRRVSLFSVKIKEINRFSSTSARKLEKAFKSTQDSQKKCEKKREREREHVQAS